MSLFRSLNKSYVINANCLDVMARMKDSSADLIYLDPPWNTSNDKVYYPEGNVKDYEEFIFSVIQQSKRILKDNGNLVLYSIPSLNVNFHNLITPVFRQENFRAEFIIPKKRINVRNKMFTHNHETVLFYSVSDKSKFFPLVEKSKKEVQELFPLKEKGKQYRLSTLVVGGESEGLNFEWNGFAPPENTVWRYSKSRLDILEKEGKIFFGKDMRLPRLKVYADEFNLQMVDSIWSDINAYTKEKGSNSQSIELLDRIIKLSTEKGDIVLDPFMGSGISGVSSIKNGRKWIGIDAGQITFERASSNLENTSVEIIGNNDVLSKEVVWDSYESHKLTEAEVLANKIIKGENERLEFKEAYNYNDHNRSRDNSISNKIMKEIAAFLNSSYGGSILLGIRDNGEIRGLKKDIEVIDEKGTSTDKLGLAITSKIKETFNGSSIDLIGTNFMELDNKHVCEIKISPSSKPVFINKEFYVRNGTQADTLKAEELFDLMKKRRRL